LSLHDAAVNTGQTYYYHLRAAFAGGTSSGESPVAAATAGGDVAPTLVVAPLAAQARPASNLAVAAPKKGTKAVDHGGKKKAARARAITQPDVALRQLQRAEAMSAAQWWWGWWRKIRA
jgi:hypothetical protein